MPELMRDQAAEPKLTIHGTIDATQPECEFVLSDGRVVRLPSAIFFETATEPDRSRLLPDVPADHASHIIPVVEETLEIGKRTVVTGTVRLRKIVHAYDEQLDEPLLVNTFDVERVLLNREIDALPAVRQEGDTTVYPVVEEQLVLTKRLVLKEELRVTRRESERRDTRTVTLRREEVVVEREPAAADDPLR